MHSFHSPPVAQSQHARRRTHDRPFSAWQRPAGIRPSLCSAETVRDFSLPFATRTWSQFILQFILCSLSISVILAATPPGTKLWEFQTDRPIESSPALAPDGTIYFASGSRLFALTPSGTQKWSIEISIRNSITISPTGTIYALTKNRLFAISPSGQVAWNHKADDDMDFSGDIALTADGHILAAADKVIKSLTSDDSNSIEPEGKIFRISPDGVRLWRIKFNNAFSSSPSISRSSHFVIGVGNERLFVFDSLTGAEQWNFKIGKDALRSPAIGPDGSYYAIDTNHRITALSHAGIALWQFDFSRATISSPSIGPDGTIYFGSDENSLHALTPSGALRWEFRTGSSVRSSPAITADHTIYFGCSDGKLYAVSHTGHLLWTFQTGSYIRSSPTIAPDGTIYFGSADKNFYAIRGHSPLASSSWPKFRGGPRQTGLSYETGVPSASVSSIHKTVNGTVELTILNPSAQALSLQSSSDLVLWTTLPLRSAGQPFIRYQHSPSSTVQQFYRIAPISP